MGLLKMCPIKVKDFYVLTLQTMASGIQSCCHYMSSKFKSMPWSPT